MRSQLHQGKPIELARFSDFMTVYFSSIAVLRRSGISDITLDRNRLVPLFSASKTRGSNLNTGGHWDVGQKSIFAQRTSTPELL